MQLLIEGDSVTIQQHINSQRSLIGSPQINRGDIYNRQILDGLGRLYDQLLENMPEPIELQHSGAFMEARNQFRDLMTCNLDENDVKSRSAIEGLINSCTDGDWPAFQASYEQFNHALQELLSIENPDEYEKAWKERGQQLFKYYTEIFAFVRPKEEELAWTYFNYFYGATATHVGKMSSNFTSPHVVLSEGPVDRETNMCNFTQQQAAFYDLLRDTDCNVVITAGENQVTPWHRESYVSGYEVKNSKETIIHVDGDVRDKGGKILNADGGEWQEGQVKMQNTIVKKDVIITFPEGVTKTITHIRLPQWQDHASAPTALVDIALKEANQYANGKPIVIHGCGGVGRSGVLGLCESINHRNKGTIDLGAELFNIRATRDTKTIQEPGQLKMGADYTRIKLLKDDIRALLRDSPNCLIPLENIQNVKCLQAIKKHLTDTKCSTICDVQKYVLDQVRQDLQGLEKRLVQGEQGPFYRWMQGIADWKCLYKAREYLDAQTEPVTLEQIKQAILSEMKQSILSAIHARTRASQQACKAFLDLEGEDLEQLNKLQKFVNAQTSGITIEDLRSWKTKVSTSEQRDPEYQRVQGEILSSLKSGEPTPGHVGRWLSSKNLECLYKVQKYLAKPEHANATLKQVEKDILSEMKQSVLPTILQKTGASEQACRKFLDIYGKDLETVDKLQKFVNAQTSGITIDDLGIRWEDQNSMLFEW